LGRAANQIERLQPAAFYYMGAVYDGRNESDSALAYFSRAAATQPSDSMMIRQRDNAVYRHARALLQAGRGAEAAAAFRRYTALVPGDLDGTKGLLLAFRAAGMADSASLIEAQLVGVASSSPSGTSGLSENELFDIGAKQYAAKEYGPAAATFARIVALNSNNRDALAAMGNAYLGLHDGPNIAAAAEQLIAIEPLSEYDYTLRIQGFKTANSPDKTKLIDATIAREALPVNLEIESLQPSSGGAMLTGKVTGREPRDENNAVIPAKPIAIVVEFLGQGGTVVTTQEAQLPALKLGETQPFSVTGNGAGIKGWRYRVK
jgi:tetratricopeptide (TPR) repeat protein